MAGMVGGVHVEFHLTKFDFEQCRDVCSTSSLLSSVASVGTLSPMSIDDIPVAKTSNLFLSPDSLEKPQLLTYMDTED